MLQTLLNHKIALICGAVGLALTGVGYIVKKKNPELFSKMSDPVVKGANTVHTKTKEAYNKAKDALTPKHADAYPTE